MKVWAVNSLRKAALMVLMLSFFNSAKAQDTTNVTIDSLIMLLMNDNADELRVDVYSALSNEFLTIDYSRSIEYSNLGLKLSEDLDYTEGVLESKMALAHINLAYLVDYPVAKKHFRDAVPVAQTLRDTESEMKIYKGLSHIYGAVGNYEMAKSYNQKAMDIAIELDNYPYISALNANMGGLSEEKGDTVAAIDYYAEVLAIERKYDFKETSSASMIAVARYYFLIDDLGQSIKYFKIALKNFERLNDHRWESYTHSEMAKIYVFKGDLEKAELHAIAGLEIAEKNKLKKELGDNYLALATIYTQMDSSKKAQEYSQAYDSLQATMNANVGDNEVPETIAPKVEASKTADKMNGFLMAILICLPVILVVILTGMPAKKKS